MEYLQADYEYANELGMFFIPRSMHNESNFKTKTFTDSMITMFSVSVEHEAETKFIVLKYLETIPYEESKQKRPDKETRDKIHVIDELGRVVIPHWCKDESEIVDSDILVIYLIDKSSIKIRTFDTTSVKGIVQNH